MNEPANLMTPMVMAERARAMAAEYGLECEVLDQDRMRAAGHGLAAGRRARQRGAARADHRALKPATRRNRAIILALVGKGVTFDTGGVSIKPAEGMEKMKYDMAGGAAVLGAMQAIAQLKPAIPVTALVPAVENMVGSRAQRPGDIVTSLSGKTIEVLNTDAEGPPDPDRRAHLCAAPGMHAFGGRRDAHRRDRGRAGPRQHRGFHQQRCDARASDGGS